MSIKDRIKELCKEHKISLNKLESELGFGTGYISKLDKSTPNTKKIEMIAEYFGVSVDYLMTGREPIDYLYKDENVDILIEFTKLPKKKEFLDKMKKYMSLSHDSRKSVDDMIDFMYEKEKKDEN